MLKMTLDEMIYMKKDLEKDIEEFQLTYDELVETMYNLQAEILDAVSDWDLDAAASAIAHLQFFKKAAEPILEAIEDAVENSLDFIDELNVAIEEEQDKIVEDFVSRILFDQIQAKIDKDEPKKEGYSIKDCPYTATFSFFR